MPCMPNAGRSPAPDIDVDQAEVFRCRFVINETPGLLASQFWESRCPHSGPTKGLLHCHDHKSLLRKMLHFFT